MIMCYTVPEIWLMKDVIVIFHFGLFFALLPLQQPENLIKKIWFLRYGESQIKTFSVNRAEKALILYNYSKVK